MYIWGGKGKFIGDRGWCLCLEGSFWHHFCSSSFETCQKFVFWGLDMTANVPVKEAAAGATRGMAMRLLVRGESGKLCQRQTLQL